MFVASCDDVCCFRSVKGFVPPATPVGASSSAAAGWSGVAWKQGRGGGRGGHKTPGWRSVWPCIDRVTHYASRDCPGLHSCSQAIDATREYDSISRTPTLNPVITKNTNKTQAPPGRKTALTPANTSQKTRNNCSSTTVLLL